MCSKMNTLKLNNKIFYNYNQEKSKVGTTKLY